MPSTQSPYLKNNRLADIVAAIQVLGVYSYASRQVDAWATKLGDSLSAENWRKVFLEHPEFFRCTDDGWASLRWRHGYDRTFDVTQGRELSANELAALTEAQQDDLTRKPLTSDQIEALLKTAVEFHSRAIAHEQERRWRTPLLFGLGGAFLTLFGTILGAILKSGAAQH